MTLPRRLLVLIVLIAALTSAGGLFSFIGLNRAMSRSKELSSQTARAREASELRALIWDIRGLAANSLISPKPSWETLAEKRIAEARGRFNNLQMNAIEQKTWERFLVRVRVVFSRMSREPDKGRSLLFGPVFKDLKLLDDALREIALTSSHSAYQRVNELQRTQREVATVSLAAVIIGLGLIAWTYTGARTLARDLRNLEEDVAALGSGKKQPGFATSSKGELQSLAHALGRMAEALSRKTRLLRNIARTDPLTKLPNRRAFEEALGKAWMTRKRVSLILFDIDHFKIYNDKHGHQAGDEVLRCLAKELPRFCPKKAQLARWGGEEFAVLLPGLAKETACKIAEAIRHGMAGLHKRYRSKMPEGATISLGVATAAPRQGPPEILVEYADRTLYQAKRRGRNRWEVAPE